MVELTSSMKLRKHDLKRAFALFWMDIYRNAPSVILDSTYLAIWTLLKEYLYVVAVPSHSFIYRIVDNLVDKVMKPIYPSGSDIHSRP